MDQNVIVYRDLTLEEACHAKGIKGVYKSYILNSEESKPGNGWKILADCIPSQLHCAFLRSACTLMEKQTEGFAALLSTDLPSFVEGARTNSLLAYSASDTTTSSPFSVTKSKGTPAVSRAKWPSPPKIGTMAYAEAQLRANRFFDITHRSGDSMERDILAQVKLAIDLKLQPGDSRYLDYIPKYNDTTLSANKSHTGWHQNEMNHGAGEAWAMDVWNSPIISIGPKRFRYIMIFVCIICNFVVHVPLENLKTAGLAACRLFSCSKDHTAHIMIDTKRPTNCHLK